MSIMPTKKIADAIKENPEVILDYVTHHSDWLMACTIAKDASKTEEDALYWEHQIQTLNRISSNLGMNEGNDQ